jgi:hypothetical protein
VILEDEDTASPHELTDWPRLLMEPVNSKTGTGTHEIALLPLLLIPFKLYNVFIIHASIVPETSFK